MPALQLFLLGPLDIRFDDQQAPKPPTLKSQSLLAYLATHRHQPQPRERLAGLFWGERTERKARRSLATALWHVRRCLPSEEMILSDSHVAQFAPQADLWLDVEAFESLVARGDVPSLRSAVSIYRGAFMDGFYDDWIIDERYRLEALVADGLTRLMLSLEGTGDWKGALAAALRLVDHDPLREDGHRQAMRAYCHLGQRNAALAQYHRCRELVQEELGTQPMTKTTGLFESILDGRFVLEPLPEAIMEDIPVLARPGPTGRSPLDIGVALPFEGREVELAVLEKRWKAAVSRNGGLLLVSGEAGVGKTRLVEEFANRLRWRGIRVLWGRCYEFERVLPYQPVTEAVRTVVPTLTSDELAALPAWIGAEVVRLVPDFLDQREGARVAIIASQEQERAQLFDGLTRFLTALSFERALLLVLEDLHWASESTLQLVHYVTRHVVDQPILLVGTYRPEAVGRRHPLRDIQRRLERERTAVSLRLSPLSVETVTAIVREMAGAGEEVRPLAERLYAETEGNPFFLHEIAKALFDMGSLWLEAGRWQGDFGRIREAGLPLPASVNDSIQARVHRLQADEQEALYLAAVLGREFDFELLCAALGHDKGATLETLDTLLRQQLVAEGYGPLGRDYAFTHHLIQEVVYRGIPSRRRQHAHGQVAEAMERLRDSWEEDLTGELAFHLEQGRHLDKRLTGRAITCLLHAGDSARQLYANQEAIGYYRRALSLLEEQRTHPDVPEQAPELAARTLMKLGLTYHGAFEFRQARQAYDEGFALWQRATMAESAVAPERAPHALRMAWCQPTTLDPARATDTDTISVVGQLLRGLAEHTPEMDVVPDLARKWEILEGGRTYLFHLRDDARWSDGRPVTAGDFGYAWKRALDPATRAPDALLLYDVRGAKAYHQGEMSDPDAVGVRALDEGTLVVELEGPSGHFLHLLDHPITYAVPRHTVEALGESWAYVDRIVTNGPFRLQSWRHGERLTLVRSPEYHGLCRGNVERVDLRLFPYAHWPATLELYEGDGLDVLNLQGLPLAMIEQACRRHADEQLLLPSLTTAYVSFNQRRPPFSDVRVRRAFAHALDRERLANQVMGGYRFPATGGFVPPGMPGHSPGIGLATNPDRARALLTEAGFPGGRGFPFIGVLPPPAVAEELTADLMTQWRDVLGVECHVELADWATFLDRLGQDAPHLFGMGWNASYPDPDNFLRMGFPWKATGWRNEAYEGLIEKARQSLNQGARLRLYAQADKILMDEAAIIPFIYRREHILVKPWVRRFPTSALQQWFWRDVLIEPH
jgi:ABC-type oligopeptide transport system substrate-binding subunit/DNA-binding SARP family transcriptional activator